MDVVEALAAQGEIDVATTRKDGSPGWVRFWVVRVGDDLYARSYRGPAGAWWRNATETALARLRLREGEPETAFATTLVAGEHREEIDEAYRVRFTDDDAQYVPPMTTEAAVATTVRFRLAD